MVKATSLQVGFLLGLKAPIEMEAECRFPFGVLGKVVVKKLCTIHSHSSRLEAVRGVVGTPTVLAGHLQTVEVNRVEFVVLVRVIHAGEPVRAAEHFSNRSNHALSVKTSRG